MCITASVLLVIVCASGLANFRQETRGEKLWAPKQSQVIKDMSRVQYYFPTKHKIESLLVEANDVLDPKVLQTVSIESDFFNYWNVCVVTFMNGGHWVWQFTGEVKRHNPIIGSKHQTHYVRDDGLFGTKTHVLHNSECCRPHDMTSYELNFSFLLKIKIYKQIICLL